MAQNHSKRHRAYQLALFVGTTIAVALPAFNVAHAAITNGVAILVNFIWIFVEIE